MFTLYQVNTHDQCLNGKTDFIFNFSSIQHYKKLCVPYLFFKMTETSPDSQDTAAALSPSPDPASGPEVGDHLPCVLHNTGALHSIVCWGEKSKVLFEENFTC